MSLLNLIVISGIFGKKNEEIDILPPPPPFPHMGEKEKGMIVREKKRKEDEKRRKEQERLRLKEEKRKQGELERKKLERRKIEEQRRKAQEAIKRKNKKLMERRAKTTKKKTFDFLSKAGLAKTEKEKTEHHGQRKEYTELMKNAEKILAEEARRREIGREKQAEAEVERKESEKKRLEKEIPTILKEEERKEGMFSRFFGKKKAWEEQKQAKEFGDVEKELEELDKIGIKQSKKSKEPEIPEPEDLEKIEGEIEKPHEIVRAEEEIQKAIEGAKEKKPSKLKKLFERKEKKEERLETPEVMPSFEEKADEVDLVEEKIHKARLALMDFKFDMAKKTYIEIMRIYNDMDSKKKARVYPDIKDLYYERKTAEKYAK